MEKVWEIEEQKYDDVVKQLLYNRGVDFSEQEKFFEPDFDRDLHDPYKMTGMKKAVERILLAKEKGEKVGIFSDYDADGIPAAALLHKIFEALKIQNAVYIPNREAGYGLSKYGIDLLIKEKCSLIVTADLGIRSTDEAKYCKEKNIDLIITDHHLPPDELPEAFCIINPKRKGDRYPFKELCGCGVVFKLAQALSKKRKEIDEKFLKWNLDLVAISTISDVVPLADENRVLAKYGLVVIKKTKNLGLKELIKASQISNEKISAYTVGFQIGPRINAPGRIDHATKSYELLITSDPKEAHKLAIWLNRKNEERQNAMKKVEEAALKQVGKEELQKNNIIIASGKWIKGVIGPTASRLTEKYSRPVILFAEDGKNFVGSARSVEGINIVEVFESIKKLIYKFGGHKGAAGLTVTKKNFNIFNSSIVKYCNKFIDSKLLVKRIKIDSRLPFSNITKTLYNKIVKFEPYGMGNNKPVFMAEKVEFLYPRYVGKDKKYLSALLQQEGKRLRAICFDDRAHECVKEDHNLYDIVFSVDLNKWQNKEEINLNLLDIKKSEDEK